MQHEIIAAGFGGQGVLLLGAMLAEAAMYEGKEVSWIPAYGPEMRGGTCNCTVVVADEPIGSPVASEIQSLVAMNEPSLRKFENMVRPGGTIFYNTSLITTPPKRDDVNVVGIAATDLANELGSANVANMVVLGALLAKTGLVERKSVDSVMQKKLAGKKSKFIPLNSAAMDKGAALVKN